MLATGIRKGRDGRRGKALGFWPAIPDAGGLHERSAVRLFLVQTAGRLRAMLAAGR